MPRLPAVVARALGSIDRLTLRERLMLLAAALVVLSGLWQSLLVAPLEARERTAREQIAAFGQRLEQLHAGVDAAAAGMSGELPQQLERLRVLREQATANDAAIEALTSELIDPRAMRAVLEDLLRRHRGLTLVSAMNVEPQPLLEEPEEPTDKSVSASLYRHTLVLTLEGTYLDCLTYLRAIEALPWRLYWGRLELGTHDYPANRIVIELHTLSVDREWIGV